MSKADQPAPPQPGSDLEDGDDHLRDLAAWLASDMASFSEGAASQRPQPAGGKQVHVRVDDQGRRWLDVDTAVGWMTLPLDRALTAADLTPLFDSNATTFRIKRRLVAIGRADAQACTFIGEASDQPVADGGLSYPRSYVGSGIYYDADLNRWINPSFQNENGWRLRTTDHQGVERTYAAPSSGAEQRTYTHAQVAAKQVSTGSALFAEEYTIVNDPGTASQLHDPTCQITNVPAGTYLASVDGSFGFDGNLLAYLVPLVNGSPYYTGGDGSQRWPVFSKLAAAGAHQRRIVLTSTSTVAIAHASVQPGSGGYSINRRTLSLVPCQ